VPVLVGNVSKSLLACGSNLVDFRWVVGSRNGWTWSRDWRGKPDPNEPKVSGWDLLRSVCFTKFVLHNECGELNEQWITLCDYNARTKTDLPSASFGW